MTATVPRLIDELARAHAFQRRGTFLRSLAKADLLLIDDFAITPLTDQAKRDLLEILDDRYDRSATIITSQFDVKQCIPTSTIRRSPMPSSTGWCTMTTWT